MNVSTESEKKLKVVREYTARGFVVHPLSRPDDKGPSPGKKPLISGWQKLAATPQNIEKYISQGCNLGIVCGKVSNVTILDFDHFLFLEQVFNGFDLETLHGRRTEGREHIYFRYNPNIPASKHHDLGIEVLNDGNNAVIPPSVHASGDVYKWSSQDAPIIEMPKTLEDNLKTLFQTEVELKQLISKCRTCFRDILKKKKDMHGAEERECMLAICTDLKAAGATNKHVTMFARLIYRRDYDEARTLQEWRNIDQTKTWTCDKLKEKVPAFLDPAQCERCRIRREDFKENRIKRIKGNGPFDYIDRIAEKNPIYFDEAQQFWLWNSGCYRPVDNTEILLTLLQEIADPSIIQNKFKGELLEAARLRGRGAKIKPVPSHWVHVQNGVYDIKTGGMFEATPEYLFTDPIPHKITNSEETPTIDRLFFEWVTPEKVQLLNEIAAYCVFNGYPIHRMFILFGRGRNGKGQFRDFVVNLVGRQNRTASTLEQLINSRFETARLFTKKICTMGEINYTLLDKTAILKMLSGGDPIPGEMKNKDPFDFVNTAKLLINTNSLPQTSDKTDAFYARCILVEFVKQYPLGKDIIETIPEHEYDNFLTKSLRVLRELLDRGEFTNEGDIRAKEVEYERLSNPLTTFVDTYYEHDINAKVAAWRIYEKYVNYCIDKGYRKPHNQRDFNNMLKINYEVEKKNEFDEGVEKWVNWVWVLNIKSKDLPDLPNLPKVSLKAYTEQSYEKSSKLGKSGKSDNSSNDEKLPFDTILVQTKTGKNRYTPVTELSKQILVTGSEFSKNFGVINSLNIVKFSMWMCEKYKPQWKINGETGDYTPSAIKGIASKIFKITPSEAASS